jgi:exopolyphosphatase/guanosine-5'-triphosphate,3'-diphosphate pyrophosphatase
MVRHHLGANVRRLSAIDIGTNTILMLIADIETTGEIHTIRDEHVIARLGKGVDEKRMILPETFERVFSFLAEYKRIHDAEHSGQIFACGTSALRDAANRKEFIEFIKARLGFEISILSGDEEAYLTYVGAISEFTDLDQTHKYSVIDIGGGSTEIVTGQGQQVESTFSLDIGSVRLTERFLKSSPPHPEGLEEAQLYIRTKILDLVDPPGDARCIGVAGTLTTLAAIDLQLSVYDRDRVSGHVLTFDTIERIYSRLKGKRLEELIAIPQILPQRADIILAGILILKEVMAKIGAVRITASDRGLRYGILLREARKSVGRHG